MLIPQFAMFYPRFIKGFEISRSKLADLFGASKVDNAIRHILDEDLEANRDCFKYLACGSRPDHEVTMPLVIVLDDDDDLEALKRRPLGDIDPSILRMLVVLEGPDVWERSA
jgi:hypothetical protein